jgi:hypothetical protein
VAITEMASRISPSERTTDELWLRGLLSCFGLPFRLGLLLLCLLLLLLPGLAAPSALSAEASLSLSI